MFSKFVPFSAGLVLCTDLCIRTILAAVTRRSQRCYRPLGGLRDSSLPSCVSVKNCFPNFAPICILNSPSSWFYTAAPWQRPSSAENEFVRLCTIRHKRRQNSMIQIEQTYRSSRAMHASPKNGSIARITYVFCFR